VQLAAGGQHVAQPDAVELVDREIDDEHVDHADLVPGLELGCHEVDLVTRRLERGLHAGAEEEAR
jgi:hypothetical protein